MSTLIRNSIFGALALILLAVTPANAKPRFEDLTGAKFKGFDKDLRGLALGEFGLDCEGIASNVDPKLPVISWKGSSYIRETANGNDTVEEVLSSYKINFRVKNRAGKPVHTEGFTYKNTVEKGKHLVKHDKLVCPREGIILSKQVDLSFATIVWWVSDLKWERVKFAQPADDRQAFTLEDTLKSKPHVVSPSDGFTGRGMGFRSFRDEEPTEEPPVHE